MDLSAEEVRKVARLARLSLSQEQVERYGAQLSGILSHMERLRELDLSGVEPLSNVADAVNRLDEDAPGPMLPNEALMRMAPEVSAPFVKVPKVIDDGSGA